MTEILSLPLNLLDQGLVQPPLGAFWQQWRERDQGAGGLTGFTRDVRQAMTLSAGLIEQDIAPELVAVGPQSFVAQCFGADWAKRATLSARTPDAQLERKTAAGYHRAIAGHPNLDIVTTVTANDSGHRMKIVYERLILPIRTAGGHLVVGCMTAPLKPICWLPAQGDQDREAGSSTDSHLREYVQAPLSSPCQQAQYESILDGLQIPC